MKGNIEITIRVTDATGTFPITNTFTLTCDNTYESIDEWIDVFRKILFVNGFEQATIDEVFGVDD